VEDNDVANDGMMMIMAIVVMTIMVVHPYLQSESQNIDRREHTNDDGNK